jgi:DNA-binding XRE family transcriptional regulator
MILTDSYILSTTDSYQGNCQNTGMKVAREKKLFSERFVRALGESDLREMTQKEQGKAFGVSGTTVHFWSAAKKMPDMPHAGVVAKTLGINIEWLLTGRGPMRLRDDISSQGIKLLSAFEGLPDKERGEVLAYVAFVVDRLGDKPGGKELSNLAEEASPGVTPSRNN